MRYGVTARRKRNVGCIERVASLRQDRREQCKVIGSVNMQVSEGRTSGALVVEAENVSKTYGERTIIADFSTRVLRGDQIGIVRSNGAGKTTMIKMLTGTLKPGSGIIKLGSTLELAMLDQSRAKFHSDTRLRDALTGGGFDTLQINGQPKHVIGYMKDFLFNPEQANASIGSNESSWRLASKKSSNTVSAPGWNWVSSCDDCLVTTCTSRPILRPASLIPLITASAEISDAQIQPSESSGRLDRLMI
ncbi:MAG: ATP-binding cassette domain-containing protein [Candidatus Devosia symbiotica]|nr:ATP-binding cassette domain-containing protein [Candidatus Devosia symbiotica]